MLMRSVLRDVQCPLWCAIAMLALVSPVVRAGEEAAPQIDQGTGAWVGGIEVGEDFIPAILRVENDQALSATIDLLDRAQDPLEAPGVSLEERELRVRLNSSEENPQQLVLALEEDRLDGAFVIGLGDDATRFPAQFVPMASLTPEALSRYEGEFQIDGAALLRVRDSGRGFLIAHFIETHRFQYLFPMGDDRFFAGETFERATPRSIEVGFDLSRGALDWRGPDGTSFTAQRTDAALATIVHQTSATTAALKAPGIELELVRLEPGSFDMGQKHTDAQLAQVFGVEDVPEREVDPVRQVTITRPFFMATTELTSAWFALFVSQTSYLTDAERKGYALAWNGEGFDRAYGASWRTPGLEATDDSPAIMVSWNDAMAFCNWLGARLGRTVRLPTEAEWEYACRAGTTTMFSFGGDPDDIAEHAWSNADAQGPMPVAQKPANLWGLYDMHGNAWEWCADVFAPLTAEPAMDPAGPEGDGNRVLRGGSWINGPWSLRCAYRAGEETTLAEPHIGFRVVVEAE